MPPPFIVLAEPVANLGSIAIAPFDVAVVRVAKQMNNEIGFAVFPDAIHTRKSE